jgi:hypothetical protein
VIVRGAERLSDGMKVNARPSITAAGSAAN